MRRGPTVLDGGTKLGDGTCVGGGSGDRGIALRRTWTGGLDGKKELLDLEELVGGELGEFGVGGDKGFQDCFLLVTTAAMLSRWWSSSASVGSPWEATPAKGAMEGMSWMAMAAAALPKTSPG